MPLLGEGEGAEEGSLLDSIWPKKEALTLIKWCVPTSLTARDLLRSRGYESKQADYGGSGACLVRCSHNRCSIYALNGEPLFFQHFDEDYFPTLRLLQRCT